MTRVAHTHVATVVRGLQKRARLRPVTIAAGKISWRRIRWKRDTAWNIDVCLCIKIKLIHLLWCNY